MRGIGEILSDPFALPELPAVLVNPGVAVPTKDMFKALAAPRSRRRRRRRFLRDRARTRRRWCRSWRRGAMIWKSRDQVQVVIADVLKALQGLRIACLRACPVRARPASLSSDRPARAGRRAADAGGSSGMVVRATSFQLDDRPIEKSTASTSASSSSNREQRQRILRDRAVVARALDRVFQRAVLVHQRHGGFEIGIGCVAVFQRTRQNTRSVRAAAERRTTRADLAVAEIVADFLPSFADLPP